MIDLENGLILLGMLCLLVAMGFAYGPLGVLVGVGLTSLVAGVLVALWRPKR